MRLLSQRDLEERYARLDVPALEKQGRKLIVMILEWVILAVAWSPYVVNVGAYVRGWRATSQCLLVYNLAVTTTWLVFSLRLASTRVTSVGVDHVRKSFAKKKCLVVGAGPVGLCATKELTTAGHEAACYDIRGTIGGVFAFSENKSDRGCYASTRLTTSPKVTSFSDFPPAADDVRHWSCSEYVSYLNKYVDHFGFRERIHLKHRVVKIQKEGNGWRATIRAESQGETKEEVFDHVAVCCGLNRDEAVPRFDGAASFEGDIVHVNRYKNASEFAGKRVVVVGLGESGADVSGEIANAAKEAYVSSRSGTFVIPRMNPVNGLPNDYDSARVRHSCGVWLREVIIWLTRWLCWTSRDCSKAALVRFYFLEKAGVGAISQTSTKSDTFVKSIVQGKLRVKPQIARLSGHKVYFVDGSTVDADVIICCTGYRIEFPFLELPKGVETLSPTDMYRYMFHPRLGSDIVWLGYARPTIGSVPPVGELQARWFAKLVSGSHNLPDQITMEKGAAQEKARNMKKFPHVCPSKPVTEFIPYLDMMAEEVGCRPAPQYLMSKPKLLWKVLTGPTLPAHYRLDGLSENKDAEQCVLDTPRTFPFWEMLLMMGFRITFWPLECMGMESMQSVSSLL